MSRPNLLSSPVHQRGAFRTSFGDAVRNCENLQPPGLQAGETKRLRDIDDAGELLDRTVEPTRIGGATARERLIIGATFVLVIVLAVTGTALLRATRPDARAIAPRRRGAHSTKITPRCAIARSESADYSHLCDRLDSTNSRDDRNRLGAPLIGAKVDIQIACYRCSGRQDEIFEQGLCGIPVLV
jgi:hypothetical protein